MELANQIILLLTFSVIYVLFYLIIPVQSSQVKTNTALVSNLLSIIMPHMREVSLLAHMRSCAVWFLMLNFGAWTFIHTSILQIVDTSS